ncbi:exoenzyme S synthesis protein C, partial [Vibrio sp. V43_P6S15P86]|nr:exoenzyme S synthesis protein C [Vibrio sp. V43_P6S15P86]
PEHQLFFSLDNHRHVLCLNRLINIKRLDYEYFETALAELLTQSESWESLLSAHVATAEVAPMPQTLDLRV